MAKIKRGCRILKKGILCTIASEVRGPALKLDVFRNHKNAKIKRRFTTIHKI